MGTDESAVFASLYSLPHTTLVSLLHHGVQQSPEVAKLVMQAINEHSKMPSPSAPRSVASRDSYASDLGASAAAGVNQADDQFHHQLQALHREQQQAQQAALLQQAQHSPSRSSMVPDGAGGSRQPSPSSQAQRALLQGSPSRSASLQAQQAHLQQAQVDVTSPTFRMFHFKVSPCCNYLNHSWNTCPYAHPGENVRRRDPKRNKYVAVACPYHKAAACMLGDGCPYAHGVFEVNLHPAKYRTEACRDGAHCTRSVCFFAHNAGELRMPSLECAPTPEEFAASEGLRAQRVKASLPAGHIVQGMIDSALQDALAQLRMPDAAAGGATPAGMDALANGQVLLLSGGNGMQPHNGGGGGGGGNVFGHQDSAAGAMRAGHAPAMLMQHSMPGDGLMAGAMAASQASNTALLQVDGATAGMWAPSGGGNLFGGNPHHNPML